MRRPSAIRNPQSAMSSAFDQADVAGARSLLRFFWGELDALAFAQQFEHGPAHGAPVEEVLDPSFVPDEAEPLVNQEPCDCPGWHNPKPSVPKPPGISQGNSAGGRLRTINEQSDASRPSVSRSWL